MAIFGYDSVKDMFDGGGKGGSGDSFYSGSNSDYVAAGGSNSSDTSFMDRVTNTMDRSSENQAFRDDLYAAANPNATITRQQATIGKVIGAVLGGPIGLTIGTVTRLQQAGKLPGVSLSDTDYASAPSDVDNRINAIMDDNSLTPEQQDQAINEALAEAVPDENVAAATKRFSEIAASVGLDASNESIQGIINDPFGYIKNLGASLSDLAPTVNGDAAGTNLDPTNPNYAVDYATSYDPTTVTAETVTAPLAKTADTIVTADATNRVAGDAFTVDAVQGSVSDNALVNADTIVSDIQGLATGTNKDGTTNFVGKALNEAATLNISKVIDTSTAAGKLLAQKLGEGNYTDSKATILGQMSIITDEFKDSAGNPKIPAWGQSVAREINRTVAFTGMTGTAAKAAVANAMMEATLGIAESEAKFFQTVSLENLSNRQQAVINKANVLAQMEVENLNARETAAVNNAKSFLQMDLANLDNAQQAELVNKQNRVDALFTATAEENVNRRLNVSNEMEMTKFYDELAYQAETFNANSLNAAKQFNANAKNAAAEFAISAESSRQQFEANMAYTIDAANAKWRQTVETTNTTIAFEAASTDVKNTLALSTEALNRIWDRVDSQLDYVWRSTEADEQRDFDLLLAEMQAEGAAAAASSAAKGSIWGSVIGGAATLGAAWLRWSDIRLKKDIQHFDTLCNGVKIYTWQWNDEAKRIGADQYPGFGVIAQEVQEIYPDAVETGEDGYLKVNYKKVLQ